MNPKIKRKILKNGMTVVYEERDSNVFALAYAVRFGGINESINEKGISHFIEHMLYKGNKNAGTKEIGEAFERRGGVMNGFTDEQLTAFWVKAPKRHFFDIFKVLTEMMKNPSFDAKEIEKEKGVIFEEMKMRNDNPRSFVMNKIKGNLYEEPFGPDLIGTKETLSSMDRKTLVGKFRNIYQPQNMICAIVGNVDFEKVCNLLEADFAKGETKIKNVLVKPKNERQLISKKGVDQASMVMAFHTPKYGEEGHHAAQVLSCLMGGGLSSRLFLEIREKRNLAYSVSSNTVAEKDFSYTYVYVGTTKEKVKEVEKIILDEFEKVSKDLTEEELEGVKEQVIGNFFVSHDDSQIALTSLIYFEIIGNAEDVLKFEENIRNVKVDDVKKMAKRIGKDYSMLTLVPE